MQNMLDSKTKARGLMSPGPGPSKPASIYIARTYNDVYIARMWGWAGRLLGWPYIDHFVGPLLQRSGWAGSTHVLLFLFFGRFLSGGLCVVVGLHFSCSVLYDKGDLSKHTRFHSDKHSGYIIQTIDPNTADGRAIQGIGYPVAWPGLLTRSLVRPDQVLLYTFK